VKRWDAFISHASEDRELVVALADALRAAGLRIWIDQQQLRIGDSLSEKIDEGLAASRFGIVVVSPAFIAKRWPRRELNGLMAREDNGTNVILPVWHNVDKEAVAAYSPILADRLAGTTDRGVDAVAAELIEVIIDPASGSPSTDSPTLARRFLSVLETAEDSTPVRRFLASHVDIPARAVGLGGAGSSVYCGVRVGEIVVDIGVQSFQATTQSVHWFIIQLDEPSRSPFNDDSEPIESVARRVADLEEMRRWVSRNGVEAADRLPGLASTFNGIVVAGRRSTLLPGDAERVRRYNEELVAITLRTYDWLVEAAVSLS
jgi:hypothetical protein